MKTKTEKRIDFLDLVIPFCFVYMSALCAWSYFDGPKDIEGTPMDMVVISSCSFFFVYGVLAFLRDLRLFGIKWMIKNLNPKNW